MSIRIGVDKSSARPSKLADIEGKDSIGVTPAEKVNKTLRIPTEGEMSDAETKEMSIEEKVCVQMKGLCFTRIKV